MDLLTPLIDWATSSGPPNYAFIIALLSSPHLWSKYVKKFARDQYTRFIGDGGSA